MCLLSRFGLKRWLSRRDTAKVAEQRMTVMLLQSRAAHDRDLLQRLRSAIIPIMAHEARISPDAITVEIGHNPKTGATMAIHLPTRRRTRA